MLVHGAQGDCLITGKSHIPTFQSQWPCVSWYTYTTKYKQITNHMHISWDILYAIFLSLEAYVTVSVSTAVQLTHIQPYPWHSSNPPRYEMNINKASMSAGVGVNSGYGALFKDASLLFACLAFCDLLCFHFSKNKHNHSWSWRPIDEQV